MNKLQQRVMAVVSTVIGFVTFGSAAFAVDPTPYNASDATSSVTTFIGQLTTGLVPVMLAIAAGIVGIAVLGWGLRTVFGKVRSAAHF